MKKRNLIVDILGIGLEKSINRDNKERVIVYKVVNRKLIKVDSGVGKLKKIKKIVLEGVINMKGIWEIIIGKEKKKVICND